MTDPEKPATIIPDVTGHREDREGVSHAADQAGAEEARAQPGNLLSDRESPEVLPPNLKGLTAEEAEALIDDLPPEAGQ